MTICTNIPNITSNFYDYESVNSKVLKQIMSLPDGLRKEIRLLAKQYELLGFNKKPDEYCGERIVRKQPYVLKYRHFNTTMVFEWEIDPERLFNF